MAVSHGARFFAAARRRVAGERHVRSVLVVERRVLASASKEVTLAEYEHMIGQLAAEGPDEPLGVAVHPGRPRRDAELPHTEVVHAVVEGGAEDRLTHRFA
jgi:hypothetical protein